MLIVIFSAVYQMYNVGHNVLQCIEMKNKNMHTVTTVPKYNRNIV